MYAQRIRSRLIRYAEGRGFLRATGLVDRLVRDEKTDIVSVRRALKQLADAGDVAATQWVNGTPLGRVLVNAVANVEASEIRWREAVLASGLTTGEADALAPCHLILSDWDTDDLVSVATGLKALRSEGRRDLAYNASARHLLGSSKLLQALPARALRAFGIVLNEFMAPSLSLVVAGAASPDAVVLIENPHAFETALVAIQSKPVAIAQTFGFGLSISGEDWGQALAGAVEQDPVKLRTLVAGGSPPSATTLLRHPAITFWGDLDPAGWAIYARLRDRLPQLRLSALYGPMHHLLSTSSHPLTLAAGKEGQQEAIAINDAPAWWPRARGLDQEVVPFDVVQTLIGQPLAVGE